jgi:hypothetical protein
MAPNLFKILAINRPYDQSNEQNLTLSQAALHNVQNSGHEMASRPLK